MHWNFLPDIPIYLQIADRLEQMIASGILSPGERLMSVRDYAATAGVNPNTMQKAFTELEMRGVVYSRRTSGRFVTESAEKLQSMRRELAQKEISGFLDAMQRLGYTPQEACSLLAETSGSTEG